MTTRDNATIARTAHGSTAADQDPATREPSPLTSEAARIEALQRLRGTTARSPASALPSLPDAHAVWRWFGEGLHIATPAGTGNVTGYILDEQGDWFEDELRFVRELLRPGDVVVDAGANHGVYALSSALHVGRAGRVVAFEPQPVVAARLRCSAEANGFSALVVVEAALSSAPGEATFHLGGSTELGSLQSGADATGTTIRVRVGMLDEELSALGVRDVSFMKLDVEGEEVRALEGARGLLARDEPLVMVELRHGNAPNLGLLDSLTRTGFGLYRLVPALDVLIPFRISEPMDDFLLNVFAATPRRAGELAARARLAEHTRSPIGTDLATVDFARVLPAFLLKSAPQLAQRFASGSPGAAEHHAALVCFAIAMSVTESAEQRVSALHSALHFARRAVAQGPARDLSRLSTLARIAGAWGERKEAATTLYRMASVLHAGSPGVEEPFLAACPRYDTVDPRGRVAEWLVAQMLERLDQLCSYSGCFLPKGGEEERRGRLELVRGYGFADANVLCRLALLPEPYSAVAANQASAMAYSVSSLTSPPSGTPLAAPKV
jgi:protein O-GlcNAc transferase